MTLQDKSESFRIFLLLIRQDGKISKQERDLMMRIGKMLDFARDFSETAINDVLENPHISLSPHRFSHPDVARAFLKDAIALALADGSLDESEREWLTLVADENTIPCEWMDGEIARLKQNLPDLSYKLELQQFVG